MYKKSLAAGVLNARCANFMEPNRVAASAAATIGPAVNASVSKSDFTITFFGVSPSLSASQCLTDR